MLCPSWLKFSIGDTTKFQLKPGEVQQLGRFRFCLNAAMFILWTMIVYFAGASMGHEPHKKIMGGTPVKAKYGVFTFAIRFSFFARYSRMFLGTKERLRGLFK